MPSNLPRRRFLQLGLAAGGGLLGARFVFAAPASTDARFVFIIQRGALDGLSAVPPYADPDYARLREQLAIGAPGTTDGALPLDGHFGLNPGLSFVHEAYTAREALIFHAVATPYRERSHFDGQDVLESGLTQPHASQVGWLNRAVAGLPPSGTHGAELGIALGQNVPLVLRGPAPISSWSPWRSRWSATTTLSGSSCSHATRARWTAACGGCRRPRRRRPGRISAAVRTDTATAASAAQHRGAAHRRHNALACADTATTAGRRGVVGNDRRQSHRIHTASVSLAREGFKLIHHRALAL